MWFGSSSSPVLTLILATTTKQPSREEQVFVTKSSFVVEVILCLRWIIIYSAQCVRLQSVKSLKRNPMKTKQDEYFRSVTGASISVTTSIIVNNIHYRTAQSTSILHRLSNENVIHLELKWHSITGDMHKEARDCLCILVTESWFRFRNFHVSSDFLCYCTSSLPLTTGAYSLMYLEWFNRWQRLDLDIKLDKSLTL